MTDGLWENPQTAEATMYRYHTNDALTDSFNTPNSRDETMSLNLSPSTVFSPLANPPATINNFDMAQTRQDFGPFFFDLTHSTVLIPTITSLHECQHITEPSLINDIYPLGCHGDRHPAQAVSPLYPYFEPKSMPPDVGRYTAMAQQIQEPRPRTYQKSARNKPRDCSLCQKSFASNRDLNRHLWSIHPIYAADNDIPSQQASCNAPGCTYTGRRDNVVRHARIKHSMGRRGESSLESKS
ncbi:hypothetical protein O1611_g2704 [Lasiodiplodia mahajangana]|uniref:Uncharacterized protein n=1 Tax=Lasiodiplodia mahajangana TaxID=1108764 RepID=A0ACC2JTS8_9PEZI|nr:hypothetical protein O1611_g2704 [Lasiodiplodia mahajangana]